MHDKESLSHLISDNISQANRIKRLVREGVDSIDRLLWKIDGEPLADCKNFDGTQWDIPKNFSIEKFEVDGDDLVIHWVTYFRGETDDYGHFEIPEIYFNDRNEYEKALAIAKENDRVKKEAALKALDEANEALKDKQREADRQHLAELLEKRKRGEI